MPTARLAWMDSPADATRPALRVAVSDRGRSARNGRQGSCRGGLPRPGAYVTRYVNGAWTPQVLAPFVAGFEKSAEAYFSPDGNRLYFTAEAA